MAPAAGSFGQRIADVAEPKCTKAFGGNTIRTVCVADTGSNGKWEAREKCIGIHCDVLIILYYVICGIMYYLICGQLKGLIRDSIFGLD